MPYPDPLEQLVDAFQRLPGIGRRSAERLAFHVLRDPRSRELATAIQRALRDTCRCSVCRNVADASPCSICADESRDRSTICVVEEPRHVEAVERSGAYRGLYHVLMGSLNPAEGAEAEHLGVGSLLERLRAGAGDRAGGAAAGEHETTPAGGVRELILATDPDAEGEATAALLLEALDEAELEGLVVTRLARGLPAGSAIEYLHRGVIEDALEGRRELRVGKHRRG